MKKAFTNAAGLLTASGYANANGTDTSLDVADDFNLEPGKWQNIAGAWLPVVPSYASLKAIEKASLLVMREQMLNRFAQMVDEFKAATDAVAGAAAIANINILSTALLALMSDARVVAATDLLSLKIAMRARYNEIMGTAAVPGLASVDVKAAYNRRNA